ncbi:F0F1 ATP synthase subunit delta [Halomonas denitrificans]|uniref:F0F1 ATP synthase subunit delta n=1 Tax=Halomonas TaxID=2745 RepID=UPI001A8E55FE|nr:MULTISPECIES: F0F1 ATP synthase subunit delta [Halomonas]MED5297438.1 F0F1 ATP synthase subunit delta [Pseudomonadota bacterium]MBN8412782.1 F0F1 ATP synthase subunit delta [Halomonas litopenaei]MBY5925077.1 F0F1 ATP synthase subunit delta [Halomonas sp. DP4Y7-2]MBY5928872.1 F0F1 ATP synthase subunit delta [Halomonas sp. DP8Y7-3]MBY5967994.1 F0F1 ATP synthase subunit delta [Halomonas denitrificans]
MAETSTIARPYAKAAFEHAVAKDALEDWSGMLARVAQVVSDDDMRGRVLGNPKLSSAQKADVVVDVCGDAVNDDLKNFVRLVGQKGRLTALGAIAEQFEVLKAQQEKRVEVEIVSAFPLAEAQEQSLASALAKRLNREISITTQVDKTLLGGVILRAGDTVIDGSVRGRLNRLQEALSA